jgi:hypothetical protein
LREEGHKQDVDAGDKRGHDEVSMCHSTGHLS